MAPIGTRLTRRAAGDVQPPPSQLASMPSSLGDAEGDKENTNSQAGYQSKPDSQVLSLFVGLVEPGPHLRGPVEVDYIAPEYGLGGLLSTKCDVYSFGIMLMETFTRKRPNDEMFNEGVTLQGLVNQSTGNALIDIIDDGLIKQTEHQHFSKMMDCVTLILNLALDCTAKIPRERKDIGEVLATLNKIKHKLLSA